MGDGVLATAPIDGGPSSVMIAFAFLFLLDMFLERKRESWSPPPRIDGYGIGRNCADKLLPPSRVLSARF